MIKLEDVKRGDWVIVEGDGWHEDGCVVSVTDKAVVMMEDADEVWEMDIDTIKKVKPYPVDMPDITGELNK